jgi:hypothetical protein
MGSFGLKFSWEFTKKSPSNMGVSFTNKKAPRLVRLDGYILSNKSFSYSGIPLH